MTVHSRPSWALKLVYVTPELAATWLQLNTNNRKVSDHKWRGYARLMKAGLWQQNGESFVFTSTGILLNGQHRLLAVVDAQFSYWAVVVEGVDENTFETIDSGEPRRPKDVLSIAGEDDSDVLAPAINHHERYSSQRCRTGASLSKIEVLRYLENNPLLRDSAKFIGSIKREAPPLSPSMSVALHAIFAHINPSLANSFMQRLLTGYGISEGDVLGECRNRLLKLKNNQQYAPDPRHQMNYALRTWNMVRKGERLGLRLPNFNAELPFIVAE